MRALPVILILFPACDEVQTSVGDPDVGGATAILPAENVAPPITLAVSAIVPGQNTLFSAAGAPAGTRVYFLRGRAAGVACPPLLAGACLDLASPTVLGSAITNALGVATLSIAVPPTLPVGATAFFQAATLPNPVALKSNVVRGTVAGGLPSSLLIADTATNRIHEFDLRGTPLGSWAAPVSNVRGVAWDQRSQDGFWVMGNGDVDSAFKLDRTGATIDVQAFGGVPRQDVRGLDYWADDLNGDTLNVVSWNSGGIQVVYGFLVSDGSRWLETSHYSGGFLSGFWGVAVTNRPSDIERYVTWSNGDLEHWASSNSGPSVDVALGGAGIRGVDTSANGDVWVVDNARHIVHHLTASGAPIDTISIPLSDAADISVVE